MCIVAILVRTLLLHMHILYRPICHVYNFDRLLFHKIVINPIFIYMRITMNGWVGILVGDRSIFDE